jgi:hypothetical protein
VREAKVSLLKQNEKKGCKKKKLIARQSKKKIKRGARSAQNDLNNEGGCKFHSNAGARAEGRKQRSLRMWNGDYENSRLKRVNKPKTAANSGP